LAPNAGKGDDQAMPGKPTRFGVGLTLAEANMIDAALRCLEEADPSCSETSIELRGRLHSAIEKQRAKAQQPKKRKSKVPPLPSTDALRRRLPGSFESGKR